MSTDENKITITYDLPPNGTHRAFQVSLKSGDPKIQPRIVQGTGRNLLSGNNRTVEWYYVQDGYTQAEIKGMNISLIAIDPLEEMSAAVPESPLPARRVSPWLGIGGMATSGLGILGYGVIEEIKAQGDYQTYQENRNPEMSIYEATSRDALYDDANARHKRAQFVMIGGGAILAGTAAILIKRISDQNRMKRKTGAQIQWELQPGWGLAANKGTSPLSLSMKVRF
jgi:hypothetical protein